MPNNRHLDPVPQRFPGTIGPTKSPPLPPRYTVQTPEPPRTGATIGYSVRKVIAHRYDMVQNKNAADEAIGGAKSFRELVEKCGSPWDWR